jgi:hypothetical protein
VRGNCTATVWDLSILASTDRSTPIPYSPAPPPFGDNTPQLSRATWDELYRIAERFISLDKPAAMALTSTETIAVQAATVWTRIFDSGVQYDWEAPQGQHAAATGIWTCPQEGLYAVTVVCEVPAFPNAGNRIYEATLRTTWRPADGSPDKVVLSKTGGPDEVALRLIADFLRPMNKGDQLWFDLDLTEETFTGSVSVLSILNICRQSSIK